MEVEESALRPRRSQNRLSFTETDENKNTASAFPSSPPPLSADGSSKWEDGDKIHFLKKRDVEGAVPYKLAHKHSHFAKNNFW